MIKFIRVLFGMILLAVCIGFTLYVTEYPISVLVHPLALATEIFIVTAMMLITKGYGVFFRSVKFLLSDNRVSFDENDFKSADALFNALGSAIIFSSVAFALFHAYTYLDPGDVLAMQHGVRRSFMDILTGLMLILFVIRPLRASLAIKFHTFGAFEKK